MTHEHRLIVGVDDIRALTMECKKCATRLSITPQDTRAHFPADCPFCLHPWVAESSTTKHIRTSILVVLFNLLQQARDTVDDDAIGVRLLLEFEGATK